MSATDNTIIVNDERGTSNQPITPRTQHSLSRREIVHGIANRIIYSRFYTWLYLGMVFLSGFSIILSFTEDCQTTGFLTLEFIINIVMIIEVITRLTALGKLFWKSMYNIIDVILVALCITTLLFIIKGGCLHKGEEIFDLILLILRNLVQFGRLLILFRKNKKNRKARNATVDFANVRAPSDSMDVDLMGQEAFLLDEEEDLF